MKLKRTCLRVAASIALAAALSSCGPPVPSDDSLIANFRKNKAAYETALKLLAAPPAVQRVEFVASSGSQRVEAETTPRDIEALRRLALVTFHRQTTVEIVQVDTANGQVISAEFTLFRTGIAGSGVSKGIAYVRDPTSLSNRDGVFLQPQCDAIRKSKTGTTLSVLAYCHVEGSWYLFLSS